MVKRKNNKVTDNNNDDDLSFRTVIYSTLFNRARADLLRISLRSGKLRPKEMRKNLSTLGHHLKPQQLDRDLNSFIDLGLYTYNALAAQVEERYVPNTQRIRVVVNALDIIENHFYANRIFQRTKKYLDTSPNQGQQLDLEGNLQKLLQPQLWNQLSLEQQREIMKWIADHYIRDSAQTSLDKFSKK